MAERGYIIFDDLHKNPELESVFDSCVQSVLNDTIITKNVGRAGYAKPLCIKAGDQYVLAENVLEYFLACQNRTKFDFEKARDFSERMRKQFGFDGYTLRKWFDRSVQDTWFYDENEEANSEFNYEFQKTHEFILKPDVDHSIISDDIFQFACYVAIAHLKYGASYDYITANRIFEVVTTLGSDLPAKMKKYGSGELAKEITEYADGEVSCKANDAFATIKIVIKKESCENYKKVLVFLNNLLQTNFPRSYAIDFRSPSKNYLPIKGLPKKSVNQLFANAVQFSDTKELINEYAYLAGKKYEWYTNLDGEECAMPSTFAVFALGLLDEKYTGLIIDYLDQCDAEHQAIQNKFIVAYIEKFGFTASAVRVFIKAVFSCHELPPNKIFRDAVMNKNSLQLFIHAKENFADYVDFDANNETGLWSNVLYALFGKDGIENSGKKAIAKTSNDLQPLVKKLF